MSDMTFSLIDLLAVLAFGYVMGRVHAVMRDPRRAEERRRQKLEDQRTAQERLRGLAPDLRAKVDAHIAGGRIIEAVRDVRTATGCGLKEAKDVVDLARETRTGGARTP